MMDDIPDIKHTMIPKIEDGEVILDFDKMPIQTVFACDLSNIKIEPRSPEWYQEEPCLSCQHVWTSTMVLGGPQKEHCCDNPYKCITGQKQVLKTCPWCKQIPTLTKILNGQARITCENPKCIVQPETQVDDIIPLIIAWNSHDC